MRCTSPFVAQQGVFGCGSCMPCRVNRRRVWTHRLMLEALCHPANSFITLTYEEAPDELRPEDLRDWLKRFRRAIEPVKVRYFAVGEYGDVSWRPHYHVAAFGFGTCTGSVRINGECQCSRCSVVRKTWGFGHVMLGTLSSASCQYIAGYVTKKMTARDDPRLIGKHPEFARMSLKPGIGAFAMHDVASEIMRYRLDERNGDVPGALRHGSSLMPLGRYLQKNLRLMVGRDAKAPESALAEGAARLSVVRAFAFANSRSVKSVYAELNGAYESQIAGKLKLKERSI